MSNKELMALAVTIKSIRKQINLSQEQLALMANIDRSFISRLERGIANPSYLILLQLASALGCKPKELMPD
ncbi:helix-turn-helix domain-containing protein [Cellvibrio sp. pealriver]|uniref:helix-turn-helix domain-containing protein n=1 Tax=Cellvibrio sp. pealriver TaxID=1622269 RepID=UPI00066FC6AD|nr:helix-turn-helix transcriptional regulator [Cellvibrio sp. pealriver]